MFIKLIHIWKILDTLIIWQKAQRDNFLVKLLKNDNVLLVVLIRKILYLNKKVFITKKLFQSLILQIYTQT